MQLPLFVIFMLIFFPPRQRAYFAWIDQNISVIYDLKARQAQTNVKEKMFLLPES